MFKSLLPIIIPQRNQSYRLLNGKCESYFLQRLKPSKLDWTVVFRRLHKKDKIEDVTKKRARKSVKAQRAVVGATLDAIKAKKNQKPELRATLRTKAAAEAKEKKKAEQEKKAKVCVGIGRFTFFVWGCLFLQFSYN